MNKLSLILMAVGILTLSGSVHAQEGGSAGGGNTITSSEEGASGGGSRLKIKGTDSGGSYIASDDFKKIEVIDYDSVQHTGLNFKVFSWEWPKKN